MLFRRNDPAYERLRLKLKETRIEAGLTQAEVARMIGRPQSFISKVETRERHIDFLELQVLAKIYGKSSSYYEDPSVTELFTTAQALRQLNAGESGLSTVSPTCSCPIPEEGSYDDVRSRDGCGARIRGVQYSKRRPGAAGTEAGGGCRRHGRPCEKAPGRGSRGSP